MALNRSGIPFDLAILVGLPLCLAFCGLGLSVAWLPNYSCTKVHHAESQLRALGQGLELYFQARGAFPTTEEGLEQLVKAGVLVELPKDPWGHDYTYEGNTRTFRACTLACDGTPGGADDDTDLCVFMDERPSSPLSSLRGPSPWPPPFEGQPGQAPSRGPPTLPVFRELHRPARGG